MIRQSELVVETPGRGMTNLSRQIESAVQSSDIQSGFCHVFVMHTSASLILCENADPDVLQDMETFMSREVPDGDRDFLHTAEGPDDMAAHVRSVLTGSDLTIPVRNGRCALGTWQGVFLWEHRHQPHRRHIVVTVSGDT